MNNHKPSAAFLLGVLSLFIQRTAQADFLKHGHVSLQGEILSSPCLINFSDNAKTWDGKYIASEDVNNRSRSLSLAIDWKGCNTPTLSHHHADIGFEILPAEIMTAQETRQNFADVSIRDAAGNEIVSGKGYQPVWHSFDTRELKYTFHFRGDSRLLRDGFYRPAVRFRVDYN